MGSRSALYEKCLVFISIAALFLIGNWIVAEKTEQNQLAVANTTRMAAEAVDDILKSTVKASSVQVIGSGSEMDLFDKRGELVSRYYLVDQRLYKDNKVIMSNVNHARFQSGDQGLVINLNVKTAPGLPDTVMSTSIPKYKD